MKLKKLLSLLLAVTMLFSCVGITAMAEETAPAVTTTLELKTALANGGTVKLGNDIVVKTTDEGVEDVYLYLETGENAVLDLNGYELTNENTGITNESAYILIGGNLKIADSSDAKSGKLTGIGQGGISAESIYTENGWTDAPVITITGGTVKNLYLADDTGIDIQGGTVELAFYDEDYFYDEEEYNSYVESLVFFSDPTGYVPSDFHMVENSDGTWGLSLEEPTPAVAEINGTPYATLEAALAAAKSGDTIKVIKDFEIASRITVEKAITLDLNGCTISGALEPSNTKKHIYALANKSNMIITDSVGEGSIDSRGIYNYGSLTLENGTINSIDGNGGYAVNNQDGSTFVMNGGKVATTYEDDYQSSEGGYDATAVNVPAGATATLNGGKIVNVCDFTFGVEARGTLNIPAASTIEIVGTHGAIAVLGGKTTINAGTFKIPADEHKRTDNVIYVNGGEVVVNGGAFIGDSDTSSGGSCVCVESGTATINEGSFSGSSGGDVWGNTGTVIKGGSFENLTEKSLIADGFELDENGNVVPAAAGVAEINGTPYATLEEAFAAADSDDTITLLSNASLIGNYGFSLPTAAAVIDLGGKTLTLTKTDLRFATTTFKNGTINFAEGLSASTGIFYMFGDNTLTFDNVTIDATGLTGTYLISVNDTADVVLTNGSKIIVNNETAADLTAVISCNGSSNFVTIENSEVDVKNIIGRGFLGGNYTVNNSDITLNGVKEGFFIRTNQTLSVEGDSKVEIALNDTNGRYGINLEASAIYNKEATATVNATDNAPKISAVAKIGDASYATLAEAISVANAGDTIVLLADTTESIAAIENVKLTTSVAGGVTFTNTYADYVDFNGVTVDSGVTLNIPNVYSSGADSVNVIEGTLNVGTTYYHSSDAKTTIHNGGKVITGGMTVVRYNNSPDAGIYIYGDGDNSTVEFSCGNTIGAYSGTFYAEDAVVNGNMMWLDYKKGSTEEADEYSAINAEFKNSIVNVTQEFRLYKDAGLTLADSQVTAGKVQVRENATPSVNIENSTIKADTVENLSGATIEAVLGEDGTVSFKTYVATIGSVKYTSLAAAVAAVQEGETINILPGTISEGTIKLPATLKNVTFKGAENNASVLKDMTIMASDGNSINYEGLTFDTIAFDNSRISITGWRNNGVTVKDFTVTKCQFKNLNDTTNSAPLHFNMAATEAVYNLTFTDNVIDGATGGSKSGVYAQVTGEVVFTNNVINNTSFRPYVIQVTSDDGVADNFVVTGNTFSGTAAGRAQGLSNNAEGTDTVNLVVSGNIFKDITDSQQICYWNFNPATTTADISKNYYDIDIAANPSGIYYNCAAASVEDLIEMGVYPIYTELNSDGTIKLDSLADAPVAEIIAEVNGTSYSNLSDAITALKANGGTLKLLADAYESITLNYPAEGAETELVIDLNGFKVTSAESTLWVSDGYNVTVKDSSAEKTGKIITTSSGDEAIAIARGGKVTLESGSVEGVGYGVYLYGNNATGEERFVVNGGSVVVPNGGTAIAIGSGKVTVNGGKVICNKTPGGAGWLIYVYANGALEITGGEFKATIGNYGSTAISGGTFSYCDDPNDGFRNEHLAAGYGVKKNSDGTFTVYKLPDGLSGSGTEEEPYLITSLDELKWFRNSVNTYTQDRSNQYINKYVKLTVDINLDEDGDGVGEAWEPIGQNSNGDHTAFLGIFDGDGHTISNVYVNSKKQNAGFFARTGSYIETEKSEIKNITFNNVYVHSDSSHVGGVVGNSGARTFVENVHVTGTIDIKANDGYVGGIVGHGYPVIKNSTVVAEGVIDTAFWCAGGMVGYAGEGSTNIMNSKVEGVGENGLVIRSAAGAVGAFVGRAEDNEGTQPISGSDLTAKNVKIQTYTGAYGDSYSDNALGYLYGGSEITKFTGTNIIENITFLTSTGETNPPAVDAVAKIGNNVYVTLENAIAAANEGDTITLINDIALTETVIVPAGKKITLDLNGKTVSGSANKGEDSLLLVENTAELTVKDSGENGKLTIAPGTSNVGYVVDLEGNLILESGTIEMTGSWSIGFAVDVRPNSWGKEYTEGTVFTMKGGKIVSGDGAVRVTSSSASGHENVSAEFKMTGGEIDAVYDGVFIQHTGEGTVTGGHDLSVSLEGGKISSSYAPIRIYGSEVINPIDLNITGGTFEYTGEENAEGWLVEGFLKGNEAIVSEAEIAISGGTFDGDVSDYCTNGFAATPDENGKYVVSEKAELFDLFGANVTLGNSLAMKFALYKTDIEGEDYYAEIKHDTDAGEKVTQIPFENWVSDGNFYVITYTGLAAKQIAEDIDVTICKKDGTPVSNVWKDGLKKYALRRMEDTINGDKNTKLLTVLADLLNYGAAAQKRFNYRTDMLATDGVPAEYLEYATEQMPEVSDIRGEIDAQKCFGSNLTLENNIILKAAFMGVTEGMSAVVSFKNHSDEEISRTIQYSDMEKDNAFVIVKAEDLVIADANQIVTITIYNVDGTVYTVLQDSMNSYIARNIGNDSTRILEMTAKFTASAYNTLH